MWSSSSDEQSVKSTTGAAAGWAYFTAAFFVDDFEVVDFDLIDLGIVSVWRRIRVRKYVSVVVKPDNRKHSSCGER